MVIVVVIGDGNVFLDVSLFFPGKERFIFKWLHSFLLFLKLVYHSEMLITVFFFHSWRPTCDIFHKHEEYMKEQFTIYQETVEKDRYSTYINLSLSIL